MSSMVKVCCSPRAIRAPIDLKLVKVGSECKLPYSLASSHNHYNHGMAPAENLDIDDGFQNNTDFASSHEIAAA